MHQAPDHGRLSRRRSSRTTNPDREGVVAVPGRGAAGGGNTR
ncbi:hypothetical protein ACH4CE_37510 [Streptomyces gelaticus]